MTQPKCVECKKGVKHTDKSGSVKCSQCDRWWHGLTCTTLNAEALKCLWDTYDATGHHWWACEGCTQAYMTLTKRMNQWERDMASLRVTVASNTELANDANTKVDKVAKNLEDMDKSRKQDKNDAINEATKRMSAELLDREGKKSNLMFHGLYEPPMSVKGVERKNTDLASVKAMFMEMGVKPETNDEIKFSFRVGELNDKVVEEPRPLCIGFRNSETKDHVLVKAKNLGKTRNYYSISVVPDLTRLQREEDKNLMKEAEQKNLDMNEDDRKNWNFRCIGTKGARKVVKMRVRQSGHDGPSDMRAPHTRTTSTSKEQAATSSLSEGRTGRRPARIRNRSQRRDTMVGRPSASRTGREPPPGPRQGAPPAARTTTRPDPTSRPVIRDTRKGEATTPSKGSPALHDFIYQCP